MEIVNATKCDVLHFEGNGTWTNRNLTELVIEIVRNISCDCPPTKPCICVDRPCNNSDDAICFIFRDQETGAPSGVFETLCIANETEREILLSQGHLEGGCECSELCPTRPPPSEPEKVTLCHIPPGNPSNAHTIAVGAAAVPAHLAHGDTLGPCPEEKKKKRRDDTENTGLFSS